MIKRGNGNPKVFSHSRINTFEQCNLKYKFRYIDGIIPDMEKTIESHLGKVVHSALEWLYRQVKEGKIPSVDEMIFYYSNNWKEEYDDEIPIVRKNMTAHDYFNKGVEFLVHYYLEHHPFNDNTIAVEEEILFDLDENGEYKIRGFIDRLTYNLETGEYEIHDYKTSSNFPNNGDMEKDRQLALYAIAIKERYGKDKSIKLVWHYLFFKKRINSKRTNEQLDELKEQTLKIVKEIESTKDFNPKKSYLCNWCEYKSICPAWGNKPPEKQEELDRYFSGENK